MPFVFDNTYARELPAGVFFEFWQPAGAQRPELLYFNAPLAAELGLAEYGASTEVTAATEHQLAAMFSGNVVPQGAQPIAQAYAGHQFGHFSPQLGDGRALLLGEVLLANGQRRDIAFKGSGRTPFSRGGDGKAAVGPMLREVLVGECMHALGIPTTRALAVVATGEAVFRDQALPGAILTRVAASHLRVGTFEYFSARRMQPALAQLLAYAVARHDPALPVGEDRPIAFFEAVCERQARLLADWTAVGFIHGVMNTDNMALSGETIDYGPCAFMEAYHPDTVFSSIDHHGRYAFANQPGIAQWNLARLAESLLPLMPDEEQAVARLTAALDAFPRQYRMHWLERAAAKFGMPGAAPGAVEPLVSAWLYLLQEQEVDYTLAWRYLADAAEGRPERLRALFGQQVAIDAWLETWRQASDAGGVPTTGHDVVQARAARMRAVNPWMVARNAAVEAALTAATRDADLQPFRRLLAAVQAPFEENAAYADLARPAPREEARCYKTFCGT